MKTFIFSIMMFIGFKGVAQLHSGTPVIQSKVQPVPNSSTAEKSASPQPINIPPASNPVKPVYPGADVKAVEIPRQLINPPESPSGTQPKQKRTFISGRIYKYSSTKSPSKRRSIKNKPTCCCSCIYTGQRHI